MDEVEVKYLLFWFMVHSGSYILLGRRDHPNLCIGNGS